MSKTEKEIMLVKICPYCGRYHFIKVDDYKFECATCKELIYTPQMKLARVNIDNEEID